MKMQYRYNFNRAAYYGYIYYNSKYDTFLCSTTYIGISRSDYELVWLSSPLSNFCFNEDAFPRNGCGNYTELQAGIKHAIDTVVNRGSPIYCVPIECLAYRSDLNDVELLDDDLHIDYDSSFLVGGDHGYGICI